MPVWYHPMRCMDASVWRRVNLLTHSLLTGKIFYNIGVPDLNNGHYVFLCLYSKLYSFLKNKKVKRIVSTTYLTNYLTTSLIRK